MVSRLVLAAVLMSLGALAQKLNSVQLDGQELWAVQTGCEGVSPAERTEEVNSKILQIASDPRRNLEEIREVQLETESILLISKLFESPLTVRLRFAAASILLETGLLLFLAGLSSNLILFPATASLSGSVASTAFSVTNQVARDIAGHLPNLWALDLVGVFTYVLLRASRTLAIAPQERSGGIQRGRSRDLVTQILFASRWKLDYSS